jgi:hypothetical protein
MQEVLVTHEMLAKAQDKAIELGKLNNSITSGAGNFAGFIGEQIALSVLGGSWDNSYDYDLILEDGSSVDVKTKRTSVTPLPDYDCSVAAYNTKQKCDAYAFVRILNDMSKGWFLGVMSKEEYFDKANFLSKGDVDTSNGYIVKASCYNMKIKDLKDSL